jgi:hypothetical protein
MCTHLHPGDALRKVGVMAQPQLLRAAELHPPRCGRAAQLLHAVHTQLVRQLTRPRRPDPVHLSSRGGGRRAPITVGPHPARLIGRGGGGAGAAIGEGQGGAEAAARPFFSSRLRLASLTVTSDASALVRGSARSRTRRSSVPVARISSTLAPCFMFRSEAVTEIPLHF